MIAKTIDRYQLSGEVGFGGMGAVYQAIDHETGELVAIKLLSPEYLNDLGLRSAFEREARLVTTLTHEAIVPVYGFGQESGQPYLIMRYMTNGSLADRLLQGALPAEEILPVLDRLAQASDYAHGRGVIHRDIKPSNVLFDEEGQAYLADFGIAWQPNSSRATSPFNGTPAYLSPEQALGENEIDSRCDIYALGVILFESLTGRLPFEGQDPVAVILKQIHDQPPSLRSMNWNLPSGLDDVVQKALAKDPAERFSTAGELAGAYRQALSGELDTPLAIRTDPQDEGLPESESTEVREVEEEIVLRDAPTTPDDSATPNNKDDFSAKPIDFFGPWRASILAHWRLTHVLALGLVTLMGILIAAGLTAFLHLPPPGAYPLSKATGFQLAFDRSSLVLINHTQSPLRLSDLAFRRISADGPPPVEFQATRWAEELGPEQAALQPGDCIQLLLPDASGFSLAPGKPLPVIPGCANLQGWLVVPEAQSWFWIPGEGSDAFEVLMNGTPVQSCKIASGNCQFMTESP